MTLNLWMTMGLLQSRRHKVTLVAYATGQQIQQSQNTSPAVWVARPGYFQQGGSNTFSSSRNNNQFQDNSFQNTNFRNQNANFRSGSFGGSRTSGQSGSFKNQKQFQLKSNNNRNQFQQGNSFQTNNDFKNNQENRFQLRSNNQNQLQTGSSNTFQSSGQNRFESGSFQQNQDRFQPTSFQSESSQRNQNRFQSTSFQQQNENTFQSNNFQQNNPNRFQSTSNQQNNLNRFTSVNENQFPNSQQFQRSDSNTNFQSNTFQQRDRNFQQQSRAQSRSSSDFTEGVFEPLNLSSGASYTLGGISTSFSCASRPYGYYADQDNSCRVFHVCNPSLFSDGETQTYQYSFMCGEGTVFDQRELTCVKEFEATPCQEANNYYSRNEDFGRTAEKF